MNSNNKTCVLVDTDTHGLHFMRVNSPVEVRVTITNYGDIFINVNDSCVFTLSNPGQITVNNALSPVRR